MTLNISMIDAIFLMQTKNVNTWHFATSTLKNIFPLHTKMQNDHLKQSDMLH